MKTLFIGLSLFVSFTLSASVSIVSDLDDTIKITNSGDTVDGAINAALKSDVFSGITEFFMGAKNYAQDLYVLSASPTVLRLKIQSTLSKRHIEFKKLILKNPADQESKFTYKVREINKIMSETSDDFLLIGDDVGQDPEVYAEIQRLHPQRVLAIYIHVINNREIPAGLRYWTSFDLFLREFAAGRMAPGWVEKGIELMLTEKETQKIIPSFAHCPTTTGVWSWQQDSDYAPEALSISLKISQSCQATRSGILALQ
jgi:hypothetical protein